MHGSFGERSEGIYLSRNIVFSKRNFFFRTKRLTVIARSHLSVNNLFARLITDYQKQLNLVYTDAIINEPVLARNAVTRIQ